MDKISSLSFLEESRAYALAHQSHEGQTYGTTSDGDCPYMVHIYHVVKIARDFNFSYDRIIILSCILHDIVEDTRIDIWDISNKFGKEIAEVVHRVTNERGMSRKDISVKTYPKIREDENAVIVKLCDRIANLSYSIYVSGSHKKVKMYREEFRDFETALYDEKHKRAQPLWDHLNAVVRMGRISS